MVLKMLFTAPPAAANDDDDDGNEHENEGVFDQALALFPQIVQLAHRGMLPSST